MRQGWEVGMGLWICFGGFGDELSLTVFWAQAGEEAGRAKNQNAPFLQGDALVLLDLTMMMSTGDIVADEPAAGTAEQNIRGKVLLAEHAGESNTGGRGVDAQLSPL